MEERRQFVRLDTRLDINFAVLPTGVKQQAITKDIGGGGVCLFSEQEMAPGTHLQVSMRLPGQAEAVNFTGEVVWSEAYEVIGKTQRQRAVEVGVKFLEIAPKDQEAIMRHVILNLKEPRSPKQ